MDTGTATSTLRLLPPSMREVAGNNFDRDGGDQFTTTTLKSLGNINNTTQEARRHGGGPEEDEEATASKV